MLIIGAILLLVVTIFVIENRFPITVEFLAWRYDTTLGLALVAATVIGAIIMYITGMLRQRELRQEARTAQTRVRELERERRQPEREPEPEDREEAAATSEGQ
ncbi:MAG: lipopolysaccharide assembly protein LapA domain-containing protein [bacterium]